jgi:hypothetical protein
VGESSGKYTKEIWRRAKGDHTYKAYKGFANHFKIGWNPLLPQLYIIYPQ